MATGKREITAYGVTFEVEFYASKGCQGTYWEPPEPAELLIENVYIGGQEVSELLAEFVMEELNEVLERELTGEAQQAEEDAAEAEYEAWKESREVRYG